LGSILRGPASSVLVVDPQFRGPWNTEVTWGLEDDVVRSWSARADADERVFKMGEVSGTALMGSEWMRGQTDDDERCLLVC